MSAKGRITVFVQAHPFAFTAIFVGGIVFSLLLDTVATIAIWQTTNDAQQLTQQLKQQSSAQGHELGKGVTYIIDLQHVTAANNEILRELCHATPGCVVIHAQPSTTTTTHPPQSSP